MSYPNGIWAHTSKQVHIYFMLIEILIIKSGYDFAKLLCYVQNCGLNWYVFM